MRTRACALAALALAGCADAGHGSVRVHVSGEGPAQSGYPFDNGTEIIGFVDGWTLTYTHVFVSLTRFSLRAADGSDANVAADPMIADLHLGPADAWTLERVPARRWDRLSFDLAPPTAAARLLPGVSTTDADRLRNGGYALLIEGTASDGTVNLPFSFGIPDPVRAYDCVSGIDGTSGVVVGSNAVDDVELTIHLDHLFLDSIAAVAPAMRFEPLAARAGVDGVLTLDDLAAVPVTDIRDRSGAFVTVAGNVLVYDPGPFPLDANRSLASYLRASATTVGHLNGEGHCRYVPVP